MQYEFEHMMSKKEFIIARARTSYDDFRCFYKCFSPLKDETKTINLLQCIIMIRSGF